MSRIHSPVDFLSQTELASREFAPGLMGKKTPAVKCPRFSQDLGENVLFRLKLAPERRDRNFNYVKMKQFTRKLENTHMESTLHPAMYIPSEPLEYRPYMIRTVRGTLIQEKMELERQQRRAETAKRRTRQQQDWRAQTAQLNRPMTQLQRKTNFDGNMTI